jgi:predicted HicB family RNase H-like nuclease
VRSHFDYRGYMGSAEVDAESMVLVGKLMFIRDVITYSAKNVKDLEAAFREAVDDYLKTCEELGDEPELPCKGTFNVRVGPERHRQVALAARSRGVGLNDFICSALDVALGQGQVIQHVHRHELIIGSSTEQTEFVATTASQIPENARGNAQH